MFLFIISGSYGMECLYFFHLYLLLSFFNLREGFFAIVCNAVPMAKTFDFEGCRIMVPSRGRLSNCAQSQLRPTIDMRIQELYINLYFITYVIKVKRCLQA